MPIFDYLIDQLRTCLPPRQEPPDFDAFWRQTLAEAHARAFFNVGLMDDICLGGKIKDQYGNI
jgi:hypothetical protein